MSTEQLALLFLYLFMGIGAWSTSKYRGDSETPLVFIVAVAGWPALLALFAILFIFTGKKVCDE